MYQTSCRRKKRSRWKSINTHTHTTPATSANIERANSALRYVKTDFRSTISEHRFDVLLLLYVSRDIKLDYKKIIDMYTMRYPRKMVLKNPLTEQ